MFEPLQNLSPANLRSLATSLREGPLSLGITRQALTQIVGPHAGEIFICFDALREQGMTPNHIALLIEAVATARENDATPQQLFDLVISGPEVAGVPTADTAATVHTLIENAQSEILLVGYAVHNGKRLFKRLAERMNEAPTLCVTFHLDIPRKLTDTSLASEIVRRFAHEFVSKHWPGEKLPDLYYDPRALAEDSQQRASLHAKCVIVDRRAALITSANFTEAAQRKNIEAGVLIRYEPFVMRLHNYFEGLRSARQLVPCLLHLANAQSP
jgi:phosphatidylserine/phosphatidylglycerophosphate/cardiolipin synthase-like enzyme